MRLDGGPRLHPICPVITAQGLYGLIIPPPKLNDLKRDGRYPLHSYPLENNEDAFYVTGRAEIRSDPALRRAVAESFIAQPGRAGPPLTMSHFDSQTLVEFLSETCLPDTHDGPRRPLRRAHGLESLTEPAYVAMR